MFYCQHQNCFHCCYRCPFYMKKPLMKWNCNTAHEIFVKKVSLNASYRIDQGQNHQILSSFTILNLHKFWHCNQERLVLLEMQSNTYSCLHLFLFQKVRFVNVRQADILNHFLVSIFHKEFFHKIENEFFVEQSFFIWFLSPKPSDLQIHWKCLCKMNLSSLIWWKVFSVAISELPQLLHANVRLDIFLL